MTKRIMSHMPEYVPELKTEILKFATRFFLDKGFKWELPIILSPHTDPLFPDPTEQEIEPLEVEIKSYGHKLKLVHSMILHKQLLVSDVYDKVFILSPNIRIERRNPDGWHAFEFTQLDFEIRGVSYYDVMSLLSEFLVELTDYLDKLRYIDKHSYPYKYIRRGMFKYVDYVNEGEPDISLLKYPTFVVNIPREFYDYYDEEIGIWKNFDLVLPLYGEVSSGGEREYQYEKVIKKIREGGLKPENFMYYLDVMRKGLVKKSAGAGIGIERLVTFYSGVNDIEKVQPFPRIPYREVLI